jgi:hypothetical protein
MANSVYTPMNNALDSVECVTGMRLFGTSHVEVSREMRTAQPYETAGPRRLAFGQRSSVRCKTCTKTGSWACVPY